MDVDAYDIFHSVKSAANTVVQKILKPAARLIMGNLSDPTVKQLMADRYPHNELFKRALTYNDPDADQTNFGQSSTSGSAHITSSASSTEKTATIVSQSQGNQVVAAVQIDGHSIRDEHISTLEQHNSRETFSDQAMSHAVGVIRNDGDKLLAMSNSHETDYNSGDETDRRSTVREMAVHRVAGHDRIGSSRIDEDKLLAVSHSYGHVIAPASIAEKKVNGLSSSSDFTDRAATNAYLDGRNWILEQHSDASGHFRIDKDRAHVMDNSHVTTQPSGEPSAGVMGTITNTFTATKDYLSSFLKTKPAQAAQAAQPAQLAQLAAVVPISSTDNSDRDLIISRLNDPNDRFTRRTDRRS